MMPADTGVSFKCNGASITKVKVTGGLAFEVAAENASLLFPMAQVEAAVMVFLTSAKSLSGVVRTLVVLHANGLPMMEVCWNFQNEKEKNNTCRSLAGLLLQPPLCSTTQAPVVSLDVRGRPGWNSVDLKCLMSDSDQEDEEEEDGAI